MHATRAEKQSESEERKTDEADNERDGGLLLLTLLPLMSN